MCDERHADDTLFFVCEEDWRLWKEPDAEPRGGCKLTEEGDEEPGEEEIRKEIHAEYQKRVQAMLLAGQSPYPLDDPAKAGLDALGCRFYTRSREVSAAEWGDSKSVEDMVQMVTLAHRHGVYNFGVDVR